MLRNKTQIQHVPSVDHLSLCSKRQTGKSRSETIEPIFKSPIKVFLRQNAAKTSTPQRTTVLPQPNQFFQNCENNPTFDGKQSHFTDNNTKRMSDTNMTQPSNVATRRRRFNEQNLNPANTNRRIQRNIIGADEIEYDDLHVEYTKERIGLKRISTKPRSQNTETNGGNCERKLLKNKYFSSTEDESSIFSNSKNANELISVVVEFHRTDELTSINHEYSSTTKPSTSNDQQSKTATEKIDSDISRVPHEQVKTPENRINQMNGNKSHELQQSCCSNDTANDSSSVSNEHGVSNRPTAECNDPQNSLHIDNISISSVSFNATPKPSKNVSTTTATVPSANRLTKAKTKVGFDTSYMIHEESLSAGNTSYEHAKIVLKGGKWRRTIFEIRKNKISQCKCIIQ